MTFGQAQPSNRLWKIRKVCLVWIDGRGEYFRECVDPVFWPQVWNIPIYNYPKKPISK